MLEEIKVPNGHKGFRSELFFKVKDKNLIVITGLNGSGKTSLLNFFSSKLREVKSNSVFFKTTNRDGEDILLRRYSSGSRLISSRYVDEQYRNETPSVERVIDNIQFEFLKFCSQRGIRHITSPSEVFHALFNKNSDLYDLGYDFLEKVAQIISSSIQYEKSEINNKLGIPDEKEIVEATVDEYFKLKFPNKRKIKTKTDNVIKMLNDGDSELTEIKRDC